MRERNRALNSLSLSFSLAGQSKAFFFFCAVGGGLSTLDPNFLITVEQHSCLIAWQQQTRWHYSSCHFERPVWHSWSFVQLTMLSVTILLTHLDSMLCCGTSTGLCDCLTRTPLHSASHVCLPGPSTEAVARP